MNEEFKQKINDELANLPQITQDAIRTVDWTTVTEAIGKAHFLEEDELQDFQVETLLVLIGLEDLDSYTRYIEDEIGTSADEAKKITDEAYGKIFAPIMDVMVRSIKTSPIIKNPTFDKTIKFILSGGDYSVFMEK